MGRQEGKVAKAADNLASAMERATSGREKRDRYRSGREDAKFFLRLTKEFGDSAEDIIDEKRRLLAQTKRSIRWKIVRKARALHRRRAAVGDSDEENGSEMEGTSSSGEAFAEP